MDNRGLYFAAAEAFAALVQQVPADAWEAPGLGVWDVRALVGHGSRALTTVRDYLGQPAESVACETSAAYYLAVLGEAAGQVHSAAAERGVAAGRALGEDPSGAVRALLDEVRDLVAHVDNPVITTLGGGMRLQDYLRTRVLELTVHSLDLADSLGLAYEFPTEAVQMTLDDLGRIGVATGRGPELLRLLTGRGGSTFSVL